MLCAPFGKHFYYHATHSTKAALQVGLGQSRDARQFVATANIALRLITTAATTKTTTTVHVSLKTKKKYNKKEYKYKEIENSFK